MSEYQAPLEDIRFVLDHIVDLSSLAALPGCEHAEPDVIAGLLEEAGKFVTEVISPTNRVGDLQGARLEGGEVVTPDGWREAYAKLTAGKNGAFVGSITKPGTFLKGKDAAGNSRAKLHALRLVDVASGL